MLLCYLWSFIIYGLEKNIPVIKIARKTAVVKTIYTKFAVKPLFVPEKFFADRFDKAILKHYIGL